MNDLQLGKMYLVKEYFWFLVPTKEVAVMVTPTVSMALAYQDAKWIGEQYNCNVDVVEENTCVVLLEQDEEYFELLDSNGNIGCFKLLDSNGNVGWIRCSDFSDYFELVKE